MNKKLFSWKALAGLALLVAMGLTSCKQGTEVDPENPTPTKPVTPTVSGTTVKAKLPSEITKLLASKDIKDLIKANEEVDITIDCSALEVTAADDTIKIPEVTDAIINLTLSGSPAKKETPLAIQDKALDELNLIIASSVGDLSLDIPYNETTVDGEGTIDRLIVKSSTTKPEERATVLAGATIKAIDREQGYVLVDGADVEALAVDGTPNYDAKGAYDRLIGTNVYSWDQSNAVHFSTLKVFKEAAPVYLDISQINYANVIEKVIIASDASVLFDDADIDEIEGELTSDGKVGAKIMFDSFSSHWEYDSDLDADVLIGYRNRGWLDNNDKVSNVIIDVYANGYDADDIIGAELHSVSAIENCTVNFTQVYFTSDAEISKVKFAGKAPYIYYTIPTQGDESSYTLEFDACEFAKDAYVSINSTDAKPMLDADGEQVVYTYYSYYDTEAGEWKYPKTVNEIPEAIRKAGNYWGPYISYATENSTYSNFTVIESFTNCKYNDAALTKDNAVNMLSTYTYATGITKKFDIGGTLYRKAYDKSSGKYVLVTTN